MPDEHEPGRPAVEAVFVAWVVTAVVGWPPPMRSRGGCRRSSRPACPYRRFR